MAAEPEKTSSAGPVMVMRLLCSCHSMSRSPPGSWTTAERSERPVRTPATAVAQAPVPQARVGPAPRSQTFILSVPRSTTWTNSVLTRAGKTAWCSHCGPTTGKSTSSRSSTKATAWGLPIETHVTLKSKRPSSSSMTRSSEFVASVVGTRGPRSSGSPMSTATRPSSNTVGVMSPAPVAIAYVVAAPSLCPVSWSSSLRKRARQRMPLPHISGSLESEL
mmetsp:Transcript_7991/g.24686  ORF Transcript_7991/g.24686 Transcript_7991/m.24686 type:complete len:220 (-) Transcript_7991:361-1020(-)